MKNVGAGVIESISTRQDGSLKFVVSTNEIDATEAARLFEFRNKFIKYILSDSNITPLDEQLIDELKIKDGKKVKTKSQRLRSVIFVLFEQQGLQMKFDDFYESLMEEFIEQVKSKLDK